MESLKVQENSIIVILFRESESWRNADNVVGHIVEEEFILFADFVGHPVFDFHTHCNKEVATSWQCRYFPCFIFPLFFLQCETETNIGCY